MIIRAMLGIFILMAYVRGEAMRIPDDSMPTARPLSTATPVIFVFVPYDLGERREALKNHAQQRTNPDAQYLYAIMHLRGEGGESNLADARENLRRAAGQGHLAAHYLYAKMLREGLGGPRDLAQAREYFLQLARQGDVRASLRYALVTIEIYTEMPVFRGCRAIVSVVGASIVSVLQYMGVIG